MSETFEAELQAAITPDVRTAMRAYLQRSEVRLSTMHRVAGIFLNGAGLLFLFPVLFKDAVRELVGLFLHYANGSSMWPALLLLIPFAVSMIVPIYALWSLIKDLVYFYFTVYRPGFPTNLFHPRFALASIAFSTDEAPAIVKEAIMRREYASSLRRFASPVSEHTKTYLDKVRQIYGESIVPKTRHHDKLEQMGIFDDLSVEAKQEVEQLNVALGLAAFLDRPLIEEVARMEVSMTRHALLLRRLVIRYIKALLAFIWTTLVSFALISFVSAIQNNLQVQPRYLLAGTAAAYLLWCIVLPAAVYLPNYWLHRLSEYMKEHVRDTELQHFERIVQIACLLAGLIALGVLGWSLWQ
jgi:hypothetical protein